MKKILMILTSHEKMENTDSKTGVWLGEFTDPYYTFVDAGYEVTLATPFGGRPPVDPLSTLTEHITKSNRRFDKDEAAKNAFNTTIRLQEVVPAHFDALFIPGGHGPLWDLATDAACAEIVLKFLDAAKPVAAVCHGPAALVKAAELRPGLLSGKRITAFSNAEEAMVMRGDKIPWKLETRLKELGADFRKAKVPYASHTEKDGLLITGQNPLSAAPAATLLAEALEMAAAG